MFERFGEYRIPVIGFGLALLVLVLDQLTKAWILFGIDLDAGGVGSSIDLSPVFDLTYVRNYGVSFGLFQAQSALGQWLLIGFSVAVSAMLALGLTGRGFLALKLTGGDRETLARPLTAAAFGCIIGGAIGNAIDRAIHGAVVDFLDFSGLYFPFVFNIADVAINIGVGLFILDFLLNGDGESGSK